ncbi:MAG: hydroxymethylbilane synthase [Rhodobacteraceae bacterium]|nr:hydroxymethylbilane synthase [Paracoccaceae bacterium]
MTTQYSIDSPLKIGTRGSPLALAQAYETRSRLMQAHGMPEGAFTIEVIQTTGDAVQDRPLSEIGGKGLFTKEIELALLDGRIDIAVHSLKDVATELPDELVIDCTLPREDVRDAFISRKYTSIAELPEGVTVGTSSLRRRAQLLAMRPDLNLVEFRGNVQTRLKKLEDGVAEATFLACAGLRRLGSFDIANPIETGVMLPACAQGAVGIERRIADDAAAALLAPIHDEDTFIRISAERAFLKELDGSCRTPIGGLAELDGETLRFRGEIIRPDGSVIHAGSWAGPISEAVRIGAEAGLELRAKGGEGFFA